MLGMDLPSDESTPLAAARAIKICLSKYGGSLS
jgi:hypothetical protein